MKCPSDLSDAQWQKIEPFFARPDPRGARPRYSTRRVVEAILYRVREGCRWRALPHDFPPWDTVYDHWRRRQKRGVWQQAVLVLGTRWREVSLGRARRAPRHAILDRQSVKTAVEGEARGFHGGKKIKAARAMSPSTAKARSWPCGSPPPTKPTAPRQRPSWSRRSSVTPPSRALPPMKATSARPKPPRANSSAVICTSRPNPYPPRKKRLRAGRFPLAHRAHLRVVWPMPPALQSVRENRRQRRGVALVRDDALARTNASMINSTGAKRAGEMPGSGLSSLSCRHGG